MDREAGLEHLKKRQEEELKTINDSIRQLEGFKKDYESLRDRVEVLPNKTRHDVMIPVAGCKMAFFPGYLHHTNEFMVMIGDDYFVEMSSKQTMEFAERRMKFCDENLKDLLENQKLLNDWINVSAQTKEDITEGIEFIHEETEEEYQEWMEKHENLLKTNIEIPKKKPDESLDIMKFLDKYKDEDDEESQDSDDDYDPVPLLAKPSQIGASQLKPALKEQKKAPELVSTLPNVIEHNPEPKAAAQPQQSLPSTSRPMSKFRASRMK